MKWCSLKCCMRHYVSQSWQCLLISSFILAEVQVVTIKLHSQVGTLCTPGSIHTNTKNKFWVNQNVVLHSKTITRILDQLSMTSGTFKVVNNHIAQEKKAKALFVMIHCAYYICITHMCAHTQTHVQTNTRAHTHTHIHVHCRNWLMLIKGLQTINSATCWWLGTNPG